MIFDHYHALRRIPFFKNSAFLYIPEKNLGHEAGWIVNTVRLVAGYNNVFVMNEDPGYLGTLTHHTVKRDRAMHMRHCFALDAIALCKNIVSINDAKDRVSPWSTETLITQISHLREYHTVTSKSESTTVTALFTSDDKRIAGRKDDAAQALMVLLKAMYDFLLGKYPRELYDAIAKQKAENQTTTAKRQKLTQLAF